MNKYATKLILILVLNYTKMQNYKRSIYSTKIRTRLNFLKSKLAHGIIHSATHTGKYGRKITMHTFLRTMTTSVRASLLDISYVAPGETESDFKLRREVRERC